MSFTTLTTTQNQFLENYLRGTGRTLTQPQAKALFGIENLRARMSELRQQGLQVRVSYNTLGRVQYRIVDRDVSGSRARLYS